MESSDARSGKGKVPPKTQSARIYCSAHKKKPTHIVLTLCVLILPLPRLSSPPHQRFRSRLTTDVKYLMLIRKPVEPRRRAFCIRAHILKRQPISDIQTSLHHHMIGDLINAIAAGTPDRVHHRLLLAISSIFKAA